MEFEAAYYTDIGSRKKTNEDSLCIMQAQTDQGQLLMSVVCDGMGGLQKGELASATVIDCFARWFREELPEILSHKDVLEDIRYRWGRMIREQNQIIGAWGRADSVTLGTTITALLILPDGAWIFAHVGDTRIYRMTDHDISLLTEDQTQAAEWVKIGKITAEEARWHPTRDVLLQCVGASRSVTPEFVTGKALPGECYLMCSDGFRHEVTAEEIHRQFAPDQVGGEDDMGTRLGQIVRLNINRGETDNITAILIKIL